MQRKEFIKAKRIVIKLGTNIIRNEDGEVALYRIYSFIWRLLFPFRKLIMKIHGKLHRLFCRKK